METSGPTSQPPIVTSTSVATSPVADWKIGQHLLATVIRNIPGNLLLSIGNRQVRSESSLSLQQGQILKLLVQSIGDRPLLAITNRVPTETPVSAAIRILLPKQGPITPLLAIVTQIAKAPLQQIPTEIIEIARTLQKQLVDTRVVSNPTGLKQALRESGVFTERSLLQIAEKSAGKSAEKSVENNNEKATVGKDLKVNLLRLLQGIRNWSTDAPLATRNVQTRNSPLTTQVNTSTSTNTKHSSTNYSQTSTNLEKQASTSRAEVSTPRQLTQTQTHNTPSETASRQIQDLTKLVTAGIKNSILPTPISSIMLRNVPITLVSTSATTTNTAVSTSTLAPPFRGAVPVPQPTIREIIDQGNRFVNLRADLLLQTEAAIARLQMNQLASIPKDGDRGLLEWLFDLPVRRGDEIDLWSMRWFRDHEKSRKEPQNTAKQWTVQLAFDLPGLGPVQAVIKLQNEQVSTHFFAANEAIVPLFNHHLDELRQSLLGAGLEVSSLECIPGSIPENRKTITTLIKEQV